MPFAGLAGSRISEYTLQVSNNLRVRYHNGDVLRVPVGIRYQYRMKKGNILGACVTGNYNPILISPEYKDAGYGFTGPSIAAAGNMLGLDLHYSKTIDIRILEVFGYLGAGAMVYLGNASSVPVSDFSWYKHAPAEFYDFAPKVCANALKPVLPVLNFGAGVRFRHLEGGLMNQFSLSGPVKAFTYEGYTFNNKITWKSIGYYIGYRFEF